MRILAWVIMLLAALLVLIPPVDAKRDDGSGGRGCSKDTHQLVIERNEPVPFKLCVFPDGDG